jgi:glycosyltransferase involved in cell wall biosynthesis
VVRGGACQEAAVALKRLTVIKGVTHVQGQGDESTTIEFDELKSWVRSGRILGSVLRYEDVRLQTHRLETLTRPLVTAALLRILSRGACQVIDANGGAQDVDAACLLGLTRDYIADRRVLNGMLHGVRADAHGLAMRLRHGVRRSLDLTGSPIYLRSDHHGVEVGGSVGHIAGVLNNLRWFTGSPVFVTTDRVPTVDDGIETEVVHPSLRFRDFPDAPLLAMNDPFLAAAIHAVGSRQVSFVYQRYSAYNFTGIALANHLQVPFVLEYNGSEVWIRRHWFRPLSYEHLASDIEMLNLRAADMVVAVSDAIRDEVIARGIDPSRVLANPNGVDPETYSPCVSDESVRSRLETGDDYVIGFIGTFGRWHGAENLATAFNRLLDRDPDLAKRLRLLMIGDGAMLPATRMIVDQGGHRDRVLFTGRVPQIEGPMYLAACDLLVSPHVPNPDGSPFIGSPTKLFEYMAMGKPIVASALGQIADILEDGRTAMLVKPGDLDDLVRGLQTLIDAPDLGARLGAAARQQAVERHTWREHTRRIVERLEELCA